MSDNTKLGLGLAALGRPEYINIRDNTSLDKSEKAFQQNTFSVLDEAYKLGIRYFDTAPSYGKGEAFLKAWNNSRKHPDVVLGTKWGYTYVANWELGYHGKHEIKEHSLKKLQEQWEASKEMLPKLKYYQVHSATLESGILSNDAVLKQMHEIKKNTGLKIGISTSGANQKDTITIARDIKVDNEFLFDSFQVTYNIFEQDTFQVLKNILNHGRDVIIKEALANGRVFPNSRFKNYQDSYVILNELSRKYNVGIDAIALRFVIDNLKPTYALSGASNINQLKQNIKTQDFSFSEKDLHLLQSLKAIPKRYWEERDALTWN
ncbi:aldo/keto reductase [Cognatitamlana onchidii]|uniref:aldo/keto reductase n=1 Tax=Cognatitamlana onchidii TaxID=2562860 RepID=UPI0010A625BC|nr:aldo/keto reductase [Algibacter onchidii]